MQLTREMVVRKLDAYLHHQLTLDDLVAWANDAMMNSDFEAEHFDAIRDAVARLGLADVRAFGLTWEECESLLKQLGYNARVEIVAA
jgi:cobyrinic acid a,c-diamide synthase